MSLRSHFQLASVLVCLLSTIPSALPAEDESVGYHVVREGETLEDIAALYVGAADRWREIWELNKTAVADPNRIYPGDEIKVLIRRRLPSQTALVATLSRRVEDQRRPRELEKADRNDLLKPLDLLQTYEGSSAELRFGDETSLVVTEQSRIILGEEPQSAAPVDRRQVEIVVGQADLESRAPAGAGIEVDIVMGSTTVSPRPAAAGESVQARTRRPEGQGALLMVYQGESGVESGGQKLNVPSGMGTTVAEGGAPAPPEKLLDAPGVVQPAPGTSLGLRSPEFQWRPVPEARSYTLEICRDSRCGALERRVTDLRTTRWQGDPLPLASYYWRITARSSSGLDGFPSASTSFSIVDAPQDQDQDPPRATVSFAGPMVGVDDRLVVGIGAEIRAEVVDDGTGVAEWSRLIDGEATDEEGWKSPWVPGSHTASVTAVDRSGNRMTLEPAAFDYDPDPPTIAWGVEEGATLGEWSGVMTSEVDPLLEREDFGIWARTTGSDRSPLVWTSSKVKWLAMEYGDWKISSDKPYIVIRARKKTVDIPEIGHTVSKTRGLWVHATDSGCGVESMRYQLFVGPNKQKVLVVEASDALDNKSRIVWTVERN